MFARVRVRVGVCCGCAGIVCDFRLGYGKVLSRKSKVVAINRSRDQLYKV